MNFTFWFVQHSFSNAFRWSLIFNFCWTNLFVYFILSLRILLVSLFDLFILLTKVFLFFFMTLTGLVILFDVIFMILLRILVIGFLSHFSSHKFLFNFSSYPGWNELIFYFFSKDKLFDIFKWSSCQRCINLENSPTKYFFMLINYLFDLMWRKIFGIEFTNTCQSHWKILYFSLVNILKLKRKLHQWYLKEVYTKCFCHTN